MTNNEYWPEKFNVSDLEEAKRLILTPDGDLSTDERWAIETPPLVSLLKEQFDISDQYRTGRKIYFHSIGHVRSAGWIIRKSKFR